MSANIKKKGAPYIENVPPENLSLLKEGDVVLANPDGQLSIIYDSESHHNCIFYNTAMQSEMYYVSSVTLLGSWSVDR